MPIQGLGYVGLNAANPAAWRTYATHLGAMVTDTPDGCGIRLDGRPFRLRVEHSAALEGLAYVGWEVQDGAALEALAARLQAAGYPCAPADRATCADRGVRAMFRVTDPVGFVLEVFWGPTLAAERFVSATGVSGFVTGDLGLGHIVLATPDIEASVEFYSTLLGFRVSDLMNVGEKDVVFLHCNPRHHSLALIPSAAPALHHLMLEVETLDDVGYTLDRHRAERIPVARGLGKHMNDHMVSFYSLSPSGFEVEYGAGGLRVDDETWCVGQIPRPSFWGHHPEG